MLDGLGSARRQAGSSADFGCQSLAAVVPLNIRAWSPRLFLLREKGGAFAFWLGQMERKS